MKIEQLKENWSGELRRIEQLGTPSILPRTRRFWKDQHHAYGWEVGFTVSFRYADGQLGRAAFRDIGTDKRAAISNAMRSFGASSLANNHPVTMALWDEIQAREALIIPFKAKVSQWRAGWFKLPASNSIEKLSVKFHNMRRNAASEDFRPSRKLCTSLTYDVVTGAVSYADAVAKIIAAGGVQK